MYYRIRDRYALRSWTNVPFGLSDRETGNILSFPAAMYAVLEKCTGTEPEEMVAFTPEQRDVLTRLILAGIVETVGIPQPLTAFSAHRKYANRMIRQVHWSLTGNCNYRCRHCYMSAGRQAESDVPFNTVRAVIRQMEECGIMNVSLSGGEALVRPDFWQIVDELISRQIAVRAIYTNGFLVNSEFMNELRKRQLTPKIGLSFDGVGGAHDWLRGISGASEHFARAVRLIRENGLSFETEFCLHRGNTDGLRESVRYLAEEGSECVKVNLLLDRGEGENIRDCCLTVKEAYDRFLEYLPQYYEDGAPVPVVLRSLFMSVGKDGYRIPGCRPAADQDPAEISVCGHASSVMYISVSGRVMPCVALDCIGEPAALFDSVYDTPLKTILDGSFYTRFLETRLSEVFDANPECMKCEYRSRCNGGCRARAMIKGQSGNWLAPDEENCLLFRGGYEKRVRELMIRLGIREKPYVGKV